MEIELGRGKRARRAYTFDDIAVVRLTSTDVVRHRLVSRIVDAYGANRIMWASDFTIREHEVAWIDRLLSVRESPVLTKEEKAWILGKTARKVLDWPL